MNSDQYKFNTALLIDDDATDTYINKRILELSRFAKRIIVKKTGQDAMNYLNDECRSEDTFPDVVFLDYFMPIMGGKEFLDDFEKISPDFRSKSKVVMLSVLDEELKPNAYERTRVFNSIVKPLTEDKLEKVFTADFVLKNF